MAGKLRAADLFCGAGGTTTGAEMSRRVRVELAVNHWSTAITTHKANHPHVRHVCAPIDLVDPRDFTGMGLNVLLASPECIFHSNARGGRPVDDQRRATAWCVPRWAEVLRPKWIIIENVREFQEWGPLGTNGRPLKSKRGEIFTAWINALRALNYHVEWKLLNAADYGGATKRIRLFIVARLGHSKQPINWPAVTHTREQWTPAAAIIDWSLPCPSIFGRKRPLADKTLRRIEIGLRKFCGPGADPFIVKMRGTNNAASVQQPLPTVTGGGNHEALAMPFQFKAMGRNAGQSKSILDPLPTIVAARENHAIVTPFFLPRQGYYDCQKDKPAKSIDEPLPTITANHGPGQIVMPFISTFHNGPDGERRNSSPADPLPTLDTQNRHAVVVPFMVPQFGERDGQQPRSYPVTDSLPTVTSHGAGALVLPFITQYFGTGHADGVDEPLSTVTTKHRHGLAMVKLLETMRELSIIDIGFRMLEPHELAAAQGFPAGYEIYGSKAEQVKQIGNSVHTAVARALCEAIGEAA
jgi:DNA (cytosine-5)-methyltransferase 1